MSAFDDARLAALRAQERGAARPRTFDMDLSAHALYRQVAAHGVSWSESMMITWLVHPTDRAPFVETEEQARVVIATMFLRGWLAPDGYAWEEGPRWKAAGGMWPKP